MAQKEKFLDLPLEEVIGDRFGRYSKYIIQDRALPDVRDGLKPVHRRILFAMYQDRNTHNNNFRKAAKTVGAVIGNYHPHGDSSVYEAMVRMSQHWKMRNGLIEMHGNNGSVDGDSPAAMRYTEARLSSISSELLRDIEKETVDFIPNFDETDSEPIVLPAKFPNLLVNGSTGISAGYATDIPPHNLGEVIDGVIMRIDRPAASVDELMTVIKGPDFPTGGILQGVAGIKKAYETGKGKVIIRGKTEITSLRGGREQIVIAELPYDVNKANLVRRMDELRLDKSVEGISEVRDETDRTGLRIVIELRKDANAEGILHFLFKNTDLQISYHFNMIAIQDKTPKLLSLPAIIDAYIEHQKSVLKKSTQYDFNKASERAHIVEGLIKAISILDELLITIRASKNKQDAKKAIMSQYGFTEIQAEAIVTLQLYRLTNTDITALEKEAKELAIQLSEMNALLSSEKKLLQAIKKDLKSLKRAYVDDRKTIVEQNIEELKINIDVTVLSEDVVVTVTKEGYIKRTSIRSYSASNGKDLAIKDGDQLKALFELNTTDFLLLFTNKGNFLKIPVHALSEIRWKDIGQHISNFASLETDEFIIKVIPMRDFSREQFIVFLTKNGMIKRSILKLYDVPRFNKFLIALNLKKQDTLLNVSLTNGTEDVFLTSNIGNSLWFNETDVVKVGLRATGVKAIQLKDSEHVIGGETFNSKTKPNVYIVTYRSAHKKMRLQEFTKSNRAKRGQTTLRALKANQHTIIGLSLITKEDQSIVLHTNKNETINLVPTKISFSERISNGSYIFEDRTIKIEEMYELENYLIPFSKEE